MGEVVISYEIALAGMGGRRTQVGNAPIKGVLYKVFYTFVTGTSRNFTESSRSLHHRAT